MSTLGYSHIAYYIRLYTEPTHSAKGLVIRVGKLRPSHCRPSKLRYITCLMVATMLIYESYITLHWCLISETFKSIVAPNTTKLDWYSCHVYNLLWVILRQDLVYGECNAIFSAFIIQAFSGLFTMLAPSCIVLGLALVPLGSIWVVTWIPDMPV